jgi:hypothetical protein
MKCTEYWQIYTPRYFSSIKWHKRDASAPEIGQALFAEAKRTSVSEVAYMQHSDFVSIIIEINFQQ